MTIDAENAIEEHESRTGWGFYVAAVAVCAFLVFFSAFGIDSFFSFFISRDQFHFLSSAPGTYFRWLQIAALEHSLCSWYSLLSVLTSIVFCVLLFRAVNHSLDISVAKRSKALIRFLLGMVVLYFTFGRHWKSGGVIVAGRLAGWDFILLVLKTLLAGLIVAFISVDGPVGDFRKNGLWTGMNWGKAIRNFMAASAVYFLIAITCCISDKILTPYFRAASELTSVGYFFDIADTLMIAIFPFEYALISILFLNWLMTPRESGRRTTAKFFAIASVFVLVCGFWARIVYYAPKLKAIKNMRHSFSELRQNLDIPEIAESDYVKIEFNGDQASVGEYEGKLEISSTSLDESDKGFQDVRRIEVDYALGVEYTHSIFEVLSTDVGASMALSSPLWFWEFQASRMLWDTKLFEEVFLKCINVNADSCIFGFIWLIHAPKTADSDRVARYIYDKVGEYPLPHGVLLAAETCKHLGCEDMDEWLAMSGKFVSANTGISPRKLSAFENRKKSEIFDASIKGRIIMEGLPQEMGPVHVGIGFCDESFEEPVCALGTWNRRLIGAMTPGPDGEFEFSNLTDDQKYFLAVGIRKDHGVENPMEAWEFENAPSIIELSVEQPVADLGEIVIRFNP